jgi:predicted GIY-YIG superfamily endonuclease
MCFCNFHSHEKLKITEEVEEIRNCMLVENIIREWERQEKKGKADTSKHW